MTTDKNFPENKQKYSDETIACLAGIGTDENHAAIIPPLYLTSTYKYEKLGVGGDYIYTRTANPTRDVFGQALADLEGGYGTCVTGTGIAALNLLFHLLGSEDTIFVPHDCYGGTFRLLKSKKRSGHLKVEYIDPTNLEDLEQKFQAHKPKLILIETPSNPVLRITDIKAVSDLAHRYGCLVAVDNTFLSPVFQKPFALGADIIVHSTTKLINGHSDIVGGAVIAKTKDIHEELKWWNNCLGSCASAFDSYLALRGLRTLAVRAHQQEKTARVIASWLEKHPAVEKVYYPGLESHPQYAIAKKQQTGFGIIVSFELTVKDTSRVSRFIEKLRIFNLAESLGGIESLICHPPTMTHAALTDEDLKNAGIAKGLLRLSVGLESQEDLISDLSYALDILLADNTTQLTHKESRVYA